MAQSETIDIFLMRHALARHSLTSSDTGIFPTEPRKITRAVRDRVLGRYVGYSFSERVLQVKDSLAENQIVDKKYLENVDELRGEFARAEGIVEKDFDLRIRDIAANGLHLAVISAKSKRTTETAEHVSGVLSDLGFLADVDGKPFSTSESIVPFGSHYDLRRNNDSRELIEETLRDATPPLPNLHELNGLVIVGHEPFLLALARAEGSSQTHFSHLDIVHSDYPIV